MGKKYTVLLVAYRNIAEAVRKKVEALSVRRIDEASDLIHFTSYGRQMDQDSRVDIYFDWYRKTVLDYLARGYEICLMEIPYQGNQTTVEALEALDIALGEELLVIEHDDV